MIRIALVEWSPGDWRICRQDQWMAEVRRDPTASGLPRSHFDIPEEMYRSLVAAWSDERIGISRDAAVDRLTISGAVEVSPR